MKRSIDRILTTHTGSLPRPDDLLESVRSRGAGEAAFAGRLRDSVAGVVREQAQAGIDVVSDGEYGKPSFFGYARDRIGGFESVPALPGRIGQRVIELDPAFPGYAAWLRDLNASAAPRTGGAGGGTRIACTGPLVWQGTAAVQTDIDNLKAALAASGAGEGFMPSASVGLLAQRLDNVYYPSYETYLQGLAEAMREEYRTITDAGLVLEIDAPEFAIDRNMLEFRDQPVAGFRARMALWVEALNYALDGIPEEQVRLHVCWGNSEAPHVNDVALKDIVDLVLRVRAGAYSIEASNPRHAHEWRVWQDVKLPEGKTVIPGVLDSTTNFVEHPRLVADRILSYARVAGRENVIAGTDCGFATAANQLNVYPPIVWAKLRTMVEGAHLASEELWR